MSERVIDKVIAQYIANQECQDFEFLQYFSYNDNDLETLCYLYMDSKSFRFIVDENDVVEDGEMFKNFQEWCLGYNIVIENDKFDFFFNTVFN